MTNDEQRDDRDDLATRGASAQRETQRETPISPRRTRRERLQSRSTRSTRSVSATPTGLALSPDAPKPWLLDGWQARRALYIKRLGEWVAITMARMDLGSRELEAIALRTGEPTSSSTLLRLARLRLVEANVADTRERINLTTIMWLATMAGQTLSDVDRYLRSGDAADLAALGANVETRADTVRSAYLALSPARRQSLEDFAQHLYHLDDLDRSSEQRLEQRATPPASDRVSDVQAAQAAQAEVLAVRVELARALERVNAIAAKSAETPTSTEPAESPSLDATSNEQPDVAGKPRRRRITG